ncbi:hypothetical protein PGB90_006383 [Kerria lacca]
MEKLLIKKKRKSSELESGELNPKLGEFSGVSRSNSDSTCLTSNQIEVDHMSKSNVTDILNLNTPSASSNDTTSVTLQPNSAKRAKVKQNRKLIFPVIKCVMVLGKRGIAFRGHRDLTETFQFNDPDQGEGNFMAILRFGLNMSKEDELRNIREKYENTASSATRLLCAIKTCEFNARLRILNQILSYTLPLSEYLQS